MIRRLFSQASHSLVVMVGLPLGSHVAGVRRAGDPTADARADCDHRGGRRGRHDVSQP